MDIDKGILEDALKAAVASYPGIVKWNDVEFPASVSEITERDDVAAEGIFNEADCEAVVARSEFDGYSVPNKRQTVLVKQDADSDFVAFFIDDRVSDTISYTFRLRKL